VRRNKKGCRAQIVPSLKPFRCFFFQRRRKKKRRRKETIKRRAVLSFTLALLLFKGRKGGRKREGRRGVKLLLRQNPHRNRSCEIRAFVFGVWHSARPEKEKRRREERRGGKRR